MKIVETFLHFFTPRHTNNHRAKALHVSSLSFYITLLLVFQIGLTIVGRFSPQVLGYASNISVGDLLRYTNEKRAAAGDASLVINDQLTAAANAKAADMFTNQYWAHTSPQGKDPWSFIVAAGYSYLFAGENLARDFPDSRSVVDAWMNSPSHRDNLLNSRYREVGFAVVNGKYGNYETTLVVQMFGTRQGSAPTVEAPTIPAQPVVTSTPPPSSPSGQTATPASEIKPTNGTILNLGEPPSGSKQPKIDVLAVTKTVSMALIGVLLAVLVVDGLLVYKRRTVRISGHNLAHMMMLLAVLVALNLIGKGIIL